MSVEETRDRADRERSRNACEDVAAIRASVRTLVLMGYAYAAVTVIAIILIAWNRS